jgi:hypothetical protein
MIGLKRALRIAKEKEGYEQCFRKDHGLGSPCTYDGKTAPAGFIICPIVQFYPKPTYMFHSVKDFLKSSDIAYRKKGWIK